MKDADAEAILRQVNVQPSELAFWWCRARLKPDRSAGEDRDSIPVAGRVGRLDVRQAALFHGGAQGDAGPGAVLGHRDNVGVVRGKFLHDARDTGAAAALNVPDEERHLTSIFTRPQATAASTLSISRRYEDSPGSTACSAFIEAQLRLQLTLYPSNSLARYKPLGQRSDIEGPFAQCQESLNEVLEYLDDLGMISVLIAGYDCKSYVRMELFLAYTDDAIDCRFPPLRVILRRLPDFAVDAA